MEAAQMHDAHRHEMRHPVGEPLADAASGGGVEAVRIACLAQHRMLGQHGVAIGLGGEALKQHAALGGLGVAVAVAHQPADLGLAERGAGPGDELRRAPRPRPLRPFGRRHRTIADRPSWHVQCAPIISLQWTLRYAVGIAVVSLQRHPHRVDLQDQCPDKVDARLAGAPLPGNFPRHRQTTFRKTWRAVAQCAPLGGAPPAHRSAGRLGRTYDVNRALPSTAAWPRPGGKPVSASRNS
jgi:hypothetical protein